MKYAKFFGLLALAVGMASAQDWRDVRNDYNPMDRMHADTARAEMPLHEGFRGERQDLARDQRALDAQYRDVRRDYHERDWR
jgi:hypothetical protein